MNQIYVIGILLSRNKNYLFKVNVNYEDFETDVGSWYWA